MVRQARPGKSDKAAALPTFLDTLTLSQPGGANYAHPIALPAEKIPHY